MSVTQPNNIWGRALVDEFNEVYLQKAGDTATGLINFDAGINVYADSTFESNVDVNGTLSVDNLFVNNTIEIVGDAEVDGFIRLPTNEAPADPPLSGISFNKTTQLGVDPTIFYINNPDGINELTTFTTSKNDIRYSWSTGNLTDRTIQMALQDKDLFPTPATESFCLYVDSLNFKNIGNWSLPNNTPVIYTNRSRFYFGSPSTGGGGGGGVDFQSIVNFGGFSSTTVFGTFNFYSSLPTISATMPANNDSSTKIPTTAWVQSCVQSTTFYNKDLEPRSIVIPTTSYATLNIPRGITNPYNTGGFQSKWFTDTNSSSNIAVQFYGTTGLQDMHTCPNLNQRASLLLRVSCYFEWNLGGGLNEFQEYGQTTCMVRIWPYRFFANMGASHSYNINNKINGDSNYYVNDGTYAPYGRPYYTFDQTFTSISGPNGYVSGQVDGIYFDFPSPAGTGNPWARNISIEVVDASCLKPASVDVWVNIIN